MSASYIRMWLLQAESNTEITGIHKVDIIKQILENLLPGIPILQHLYVGDKGEKTYLNSTRQFGIKKTSILRVNKRPIPICIIL